MSKSVQQGHSKLRNSGRSSHSRNSGCQLRARMTEVERRGHPGRSAHEDDSDGTQRLRLESTYAVARNHQYNHRGHPGEDQDLEGGEHRIGDWVRGGCERGESHDEGCCVTHLQNHHTDRRGDPDPTVRAQANGERGISRTLKWRSHPVAINSRSATTAWIEAGSTAARNRSKTLSLDPWLWNCLPRARRPMRSESIGPDGRSRPGGRLRASGRSATRCGRAQRRAGAVQA